GLDEIVQAGLVVRNVNDPAGPCRLLGNLDVLVDPLDLAENGIQRMLEGPVNRVPLRRPQLVEIAVDPLACLQLALPVPATQVARDVLPGQHRLSNVVWKHVLGLYQRPFSISLQIASVNSVVVAWPP